MFVLIPVVISLVFEIREHTLKQWVLFLFTRRLPARSILQCALFISIGLGSSYGYAMVAGEPDLFINTYSTIFSVFLNSIYLFAIALLEEMAWRGFFLKRLSMKQEKMRFIFYVGVIWGLWHIPMWSIRNLLTVQEIILYFVWTILLSFILGMFYYRYHSVLILAFLHMIFNTCFLAPVQWNILIVLIVVPILTGFYKLKKCNKSI